MKQNDEKTIRMFNRMRARRGRIMKRINAKSSSNGSYGLKTHYSLATKASGEVTGGKTGRTFDFTMFVYVALLTAFVLIVILGSLGAAQICDQGSFCSPASRSLV